jgi:hypothetical protein
MRKKSNGRVCVVILHPKGHTPPTTHLSPWADEVLLLPQRGPITDFAQARNIAFARTRCDWLCFLDSDEMLYVSRAVALEVLRRADALGYRGIAGRRSDLYLGKVLRHGEAAHQRVVRFVRRGFGHFVRPVHEVLLVSGPIMETPLTIAHHSHDSLQQFIAVVGYYASLEGKQRQYAKYRLLMELLCYPVGKLLYQLIVQGGLRDGYRGVVYAIAMALHSFWVRVFAYEHFLALHHTRAEA